jgi:hypothetical protein
MTREIIFQQIKVFCLVSSGKKSLFFFVRTDEKTFVHLRFVGQFRYVGCGYA